MAVIVVSGRPGSGSSTTAKLLAKRLKLKHFSAGDYYKKHVAGSRSHAVRSIKTKAGADRRTHNSIDRMQVRIARRGNIVIESKTGIHFIKNADFRVWLKASSVVVAKRMSKQEKIPVKTAGRLIKERDAGERKMFRKLYGFDTFAQEKKADFVVDTSRMKPDSIVDLIISKLPKAFVVHRWTGAPDMDWYPYARKELEKKGYMADVLSMPHTNRPTEREWVPFLSGAVGVPGENTVLIGHSAGVMTILRYLETLKPGQKVGCCVLVAGWIDDIGYNELSNFFTKPIKWAKIRRHCNKFIAIHSDNDPYVKMYHGYAFRKHLKAKLIVEHGKGHLDDDSGVKKLPSAVSAIKNISR